MVIIQLCRCGQKEVKHVLMENQTMSEKKPTWMCPVCGKPAPYDQLIIDGLLSKILSECEDANEIKYLVDGSWWRMRKRMRRRAPGPSNSVSSRRSWCWLTDCLWPSPPPPQTGYSTFLVLTHTEEAQVAPVPYPDKIQNILEKVQWIHTGTRGMNFHNCYKTHMRRKGMKNKFLP
uniref:Uncharacterized protein n=4 Tax=Canis lupus familiaris TaxID=9615 RepID=A0A8I3NL08_CANLF